MTNHSSRHLWKAPRIKTLQEIEWERKENKKKHWRRIGTFLICALAILSLFL